MRQPVMRTGSNMKDATAISIGNSRTIRNSTHIICTAVVNIKTKGKSTNAKTKFGQTYATLQFISQKTTGRKGTTDWWIRRTRSADSLQQPKERKRADRR